MKVSTKDKYEDARKLFKWIERFFVTLGVWPLRPSTSRFSVWITYMAIHFFFSQVYLYYVFGDLQAMVMNVTDTGLMIMVSSRLIMLKFSRKLGSAVQLVIDFIDRKSFRHDEEWQLYLHYNRISKSYFKTVVPAALITTVLFWTKPMKNQRVTALNNETKPYTLAYTTNYFIEVNDDVTFYLIWIYNFPMVFFAPWYTSSIGLLVSLVYHISGRLSVLSYRIKNLRVQDFEHEQVMKMVFHELVHTHLEIVELAKNVNKVFGPLLLNELFITTVIIGLTIYSSLVSIDVLDAVEIFSALSYGICVLLLIYSSCAAGEHVVIESSKLYAAYYECSWYDMPVHCQKQLVICMVGASRPIQLSAAGFNTYSRFLFVSVSFSFSTFVFFSRIKYSMNFYRF
uniref:Odorant receptor n=1 Tax=Campoletis chlorideae TaxID=219166 RepID=A0A346D410_9HYME|nr:odorant receptor [Campoletis chlorideae]